MRRDNETLRDQIRNLRRRSPTSATLLQTMETEELISRDMARVLFGSPATASRWSI
jgi:hypothetical protein